MELLLLKMGTLITCLLMCTIMRQEKTASNLNIYDADYTMEAAVRFDNSPQGMVFELVLRHRQGLHVGAGSYSRMYQVPQTTDGFSAK